MMGSPGAGRGAEHTPGLFKIRIAPCDFVGAWRMAAIAFEMVSPDSDLERI